MPRFVILRHDPPAGGTRSLHWDLMFEVGDSLATWAVEDEPRAGVPLRAQILPDHRLAYLEYEGPLSHDRGHVTRWDRGSYQEIENTPTGRKYAIQGRSLRGTLTLVSCREDPHRWTVTFSGESSDGSAPGDAAGSLPSV